MSVRIIKQGLFDTIQDEGRYGYQHLGINVCGVMDKVAARISNMLAGNNSHEAVIELHYPSSSFLFEDCHLIALSGADFSATLNDEPVSVNSAALVSKNSVLKFTGHKKGARSYLAIHGGWNVKPWLNSYSTNVRASSGGYNGRALRKEDVLTVKKQRLGLPKLNEKSFRILSPPVSSTSVYTQDETIRCTRGNEYNWLSEASQTHFFSAFFQINIQSDRMGYRLSGNALNVQNDEQKISEAVIRGAIQLLPSGQLIILMADHQTTGGYPVIAHVTSANIPKLAQMRPNEKIQFQLVTFEQAEQEYLAQEEYLQWLRDTVNFQLSQFINS